MNPAEETKVVILGAGGHASVVIDAMLAAGNCRPCAVVDANDDRWGQNVLGVPVRGNDDLLPVLRAEGIKRFAVGVGSTAATSARRRLFDEACAAGLEPVTVIHPFAYVSPHADAGRGTQVLAGAVINAGAEIGENVIVNSRAVIEHDCHIDSHTHVAPGAIISGGVRIGTGCHIGCGAALRQGISIGSHSVVGAGAAVVSDVPSGTTVVGVPARKLRKAA